MAKGKIEASGDIIWLYSGVLESFKPLACPRTQTLLAADALKVPRTITDPAIAPSFYRDAD